MAVWSEYRGVVDEARRLIAEANELRQDAEATILRAREQCAKQPPPRLADRRIEELEELIENLNKRLESQPVIEQAKGILMARSGCTPNQAFDVLRRASMRSNRKLREVAAEIVEATTRVNGRPPGRQLRESGMG